MKPEGDKNTKVKKDISIDTSKIKSFLLNFVTPIVALSVSLIIFFLYIHPSIKNLPVEKQKLAEKISLERTLDSKLSKLNQLTDFKNILDENSEMINKVLVPEAEVPRLLDQVNQIATNSGMVVDRLGYSYSVGDVGNLPGGESGAFNVVTISLGTNSNYDQMIVFMELIENAARFVSVSSFRYSTSSLIDMERSLAGSFSIDSPYLFVQSNAVTDEPIDLDVSSSSFTNFVNMIRSLQYYDFMDTTIEAYEETPNASEGEEQTMQESEVTEFIENIEVVENQPVPPETGQ